MQEKKTLFVADIRPGDKIEDVYLLAEKNISSKKDGKPYLTLVLSDKSGRIKGVAWDNVEQIAAAAKTGAGYCAHTDRPAFVLIGIF